MTSPPGPVAAGTPASGTRAPGALRSVRHPVAWAVTGLLAVGALFPASPLREVASGEAPGGVRLEVGAPYLALAPLFNTWDHLGVLPLSTHLAVIVSGIMAFLAWRVFRRGRPRPLVHRVGVEMLAVVAGVGGLLLFYLGGLLLGRPMAALVVDDPEVLVIDLHSHTDHSHDGRRGFNWERNREWHASAGFHAVLVTDHYNWGGYQDAHPHNPLRAGTGTVLLQGAELKLFGKHTNVMGDSLRYKPWIDDTGRNLKPEELEAAIRSGMVPPPTFLMALPVDLSDFQGYSPDTPLGLIGLEVNDASPKGMEQSLRDRDRLLAIADSLDLAIFAGSNNHGWGRTAAGWSLMRLPGWRDWTPRQLEERVEAELHGRRRGAVTVVERRVPWHGGNRVRLALSAPEVALNLFRSLSWGERLSWLAWAWGLAWLAAGLAPATRPGRPASAIRR